jgi:hypothetical protein
MRRLTVDITNGESLAPKRGDLVQTNIGTKKERTWFIMKSRTIKRRQPGPPRYELYAARWWELEPETRMALYRSAERHGGQWVINYYPYPAKKKKNFEQTMGGIPWKTK